MTTTESKETDINSSNEIQEEDKKGWKIPEFSKPIRIMFTILANFITFLNFSCGIIAIILVSIDPRNAVYASWAGKLILLAIIFDFSDGIPARLAQKKPGFFGTFVDSAADTISFGLAPAVIISLSMPLLSTESTAHLALAICSIAVGCYFGFCTIFRLIRFTKAPSKKWFKGIPSPGAGCAAAIYIIIKAYIETEAGSTSIATPIVGLILMILTGTMMIVTIRYPTTKLRKNPLEIFLLGLAAVTIVVVVAIPLKFIIYPAAFMGALTVFYVLYGPFYLLAHMMERAKETEDY
ncbi:MAG: hypothetical protein FK733_05075 [Asgard group archaeon]|nr:hypothetical protein [Asgard group archaeon]